eukprot:9422647-Pyramimonas_sp.AAC.1
MPLKPADSSGFLKGAAFSLSGARCYEDPSGYFNIPWVSLKVFRMPLESSRIFGLLQDAQGFLMVFQYSA